MTEIFVSGTEVFRDAKMTESPYESRRVDMYVHGEGQHQCETARTICEPAPDLGLWRPLGNNVIENSSTSRAYQLNDCKNMHSIMLRLKMSRNVAACYRPGMSRATFASTKVSDGIYVFQF